MFVNRCWLRFILLLVVVAATGCNSVAWNYDCARGLQNAARQRRRAVVVFAAASSRDSSEMDWTVWTDGKVRELMREFVAVRQDLYLNRTQAEQLGVKEVPAIVVVRPDGTIAGTNTGKLTPEALRIFLIKNRFN